MNLPGKLWFKNLKCKCSLLMAVRVENINKSILIKYTTYIRHISYEVIVFRDWMQIHFLYSCEPSIKWC